MRGSQSSTLVIRGMALNELGTKDVGRILRKELGVELSGWCVLSAANFLRLILMYPGYYTALRGFPGAACHRDFGCHHRRMRLAAGIKADPAIMAAPVVTTLVDACSLIIYFKIVELLLL